ncbi:hypothetical protein CP532_2775 [Ophiocordyceps camponoti-leonardi (nom. inval.)]|nr:hypothetical protein CP532_2775 [Ophiocordyceps camponoti-leonardi (nom. inval.)]
MPSRTCGSMHDMQQYQQWEADRNPRAWSYPVIKATLALWRTAIGGYTGGISPLLHSSINCTQDSTTKAPLDSRTSFPWFSCHRTRASIRRHTPPHRYFFAVGKGYHYFSFLIAGEEPYPGQRLPSLAEPEVRLTPRAGMRLSVPGSCPGYPVPIKSGSLPRGSSVQRKHLPLAASGSSGGILGTGE